MKSLEKLFGHFDLPHLRFLCRCFALSSQGTKPELISRLLGAPTPGLRIVLFHKFPKAELERIAKKLDIMAEGTREEIEASIMGSIEFSAQHQGDFDYYKLKDGRLNLYKVNVGNVLNRLQLQDLKDLCRELALNVGGKKPLLVRRLWAHPSVDLRYALEGLDEGGLTKVAQDMGIDPIPRARNKQIEAILSKRHSVGRIDTARKTHNHKYDVAISFAGEQRAIATEIAEAMKLLGLRVFLDVDEQSRLWGAPLAEYLNDVFSRQARYGVFLVSVEQQKKAWPRHEQRAALAKHIESGGDFILPILVDGSWIEGLPEDTGFLRWSETSAAGLAEYILQKLQSNSVA